MAEVKDSSQRSFHRSQQLFKDQPLKHVLGFVSLFAVLYTAYSFFNIYLSELMASVYTILPFALLNYVWSAVAQAKEVEVKYALVLDWLDLSIRTHIGVICASVLALFGLKFFNTTTVPTVEAPQIEVPEKLLLPSPPLAYE